MPLSKEHLRVSADDNGVLVGEVFSDLPSVSPLLQWNEASSTFYSALVAGCVRLFGAILRLRERELHRVPSR